MVSSHGQIRGHGMQLRKDAHAGGQAKYVVELAQTLARLPGVSGVDLFTRLVSAFALDPDYVEETEELDDGIRERSIFARYVETG